MMITTHKMVGHNQITGLISGTEKKFAITKNTVALSTIRREKENKIRVMMR